MRVRIGLSHGVSEILNVGISRCADIILLHIFVKVISCQPNVQYLRYWRINLMVSRYIQPSSSVSISISTLCPFRSLKIRYFMVGICIHPFPTYVPIHLFRSLKIWSFYWGWTRVGELFGVIAPLILKLMQNFIRMCTRPAPRTQCAIKFRWISSFYIVNLC